MAKTLYVKLDAGTREPRRLLRADDSGVEVWYQGEWKPTTLMQAELDGLGGSADYYTVKTANRAKWQKKLNG